jgi:Polyketide cyclase / dehydrase and lipid transport
LWSEPGRWPEWHPQFESVDFEGVVAMGDRVRVKLRKGGRMELQVVTVEPERLLVHEARMPGARLGHEHRLEPKGKGSEITHRLYVRGPFSGLFALLLGRKRMEELVVEFIERERELAE